MVEETPITITNSQSAPTPSPFQEQLTIDSATFARYINSNWSNVEFRLSSGGLIPAWIESGATNTSTSTVVWLRLASIPALGTVQVGMDFAPTTCFLLSSAGPIGEAPQLSATYAAFDDGATVFDFYDDFAGTTVSSGYVVVSGPTITQNNGLTICCAAVGGLTWATGFAPPIIFDADVTAVTGPYPGLFLQNGSSSTSGGYTLDDDAGGCTCSVGVGSITIGVSPVAPAIQLAPGIMGGAWTATGSQTWYENYVAYAGTSTTYALPSAEYVSYALVAASLSTASISLQWARVHAYPPNGVMPTASYGSTIAPVAAGPATPGTPAIDSGQSIALSVSISGGTSPYTYQWYTGNLSSCSSNSVVSGATGTSLSVAPTTNTSYCYTVTDLAGASSSSTLDTVKVYPVLSANTPIPPTGKVDAGQLLHLSSNVSGGAPPYSYQWFSGNSSSCASDSVITGATAWNYTVLLNATRYYCYFVGDSSLGSPSAGSQSPTAWAVVNSSLLAGPPSPTSVAIDIGQTVRLSSAPTGGTLPYSFQWYSSSQNTIPCSSGAPVSGATGASWTGALSGTAYFCYIVSDSATTPSVVDSSWSLVTVNPALRAAGPSPGNSSIDVGQSLNLTATPSGGTLPWSLQWYESSGSPSSCSNGTMVANSNSTHLTVAPTTTAKFCYLVTDHASTPAVVASNWSIVTVRPALGAGSITPGNPTISIGQSLLLKASPLGGSPPYLLAWYSGAQSNCGLDSLVASAHGMDLNVTPTSATYYCYSVSDSSVGIPAVHTMSPSDLVGVAPPALKVLSFQALPSNLTLGQGTNLSVQVTGGDLPYTYHYSGLPSGCTSTNASHLTCVPSSAGMYNVSILATDPFGQSTTAATTLDVHPAIPPLAVALSANRTSVTTGEGFELTILLQGGQAPYQYVWLLNGTNDTKAPDASQWALSLDYPGNYSFQADVRDARGTIATTATVHVLVQSPSSPPNKAPSVISEYLPYLLVIAILGAIVAVGILILRRRRARSGASNRAENTGVREPPGATDAPTAVAAPSEGLSAGMPLTSMHGEGASAQGIPPPPAATLPPSPPPTTPTSYAPLSCVLCGGRVTSDLVCERCGYEIVPGSREPRKVEPAPESSTVPTEGPRHPGPTSTRPSDGAASANVARTNQGPRSEAPKPPAPGAGGSGPEDSRPPQPGGAARSPDSVEDITRELENWLKKKGKSGNGPKDPPGDTSGA